MIYRRSYRLGILLSPIHRPLQYCGEKYKRNDAKHYMMIINIIIYIICIHYHDHNKVMALMARNIAKYAAEFAQGTPLFW